MVAIEAGQSSEKCRFFVLGHNLVESRCHSTRLVGWAESKDFHTDFARLGARSGSQDVFEERASGTALITRIVVINSHVFHCDKLASLVLAPKPGSPHFTSLYYYTLYREFSLICTG